MSTMIRATVLGLLAIGLVSALSECDDKNTTSLQWTGASFKWPSSTTKTIFKSSGKYISKNHIVTRAQIYKRQVFMAMPRLRSGIAATLVTTSMTDNSCQAKLIPYPCWSQQEEGNCNAFQSVVDITLDPKNILWVLDTGIVNTLENPIRQCPPKVVGIDVETKKIIKKLDLTGLVNAASRLQYIAADYDKDGRCFIYVTDAATRAILVFDVDTGKGSRVVLPSEITTGCTKRDVLYMALIRKSCGNNVLYFTYLCSCKIFSIKTEYLRRGSCNGRVHEIGTKSNRLVILGTDGGCALFFRYEGQSDIYRWDACNTSFKSINFKPVYKSDTCFLVTHAFPDVQGNKMQVLESNFPDYIQGKMGCGVYQEINAMGGCF